MSRYINPANESKEAFLARNGIAAPTNISFAEVPNDCELVALVLNGGFSVAAVVDDQRDLDEIRDPSDKRSKFWFFVKKSDLQDETPDAMEAYRRIKRKGELV